MKQDSRARADRRRSASRRLHELAPHTHWIKRNDPKCMHVTVWLDRERRLEWWPGTGRWTDIGRSKPAHHGNFDAFKTWVEGQRHAA